MVLHTCISMGQCALFCMYICFLKSPVDMLWRMHIHFAGTCIHLSVTKRIHITNESAFMLQIHATKCIHVTNERGTSTG